jgi:thioredoxin reductase (NADPH)
MTRKPVILAVDDEPPVAAAITRDLRRRYGEKYWVIGANSGAEAIATIEELVEKREPIALVVADQRMPNVTGIEVLTVVAKKAPQARTVLLTAYADTQVAIDAINKVGLDHYLQKPWDPPDDRLYPVLDDLLQDWRAQTYLPWDGIQVLGAAWSVRTHELQGFLSRQRIPYHYADVECDPRATELLAATVSGTTRLPVVIYGDGTTAIDPDLRTVAEKVGLKTELQGTNFDVVIIGAGPAGLAASVFCAAEGVRCVVIEKGEIGGLAATSPRIENYLGFPAGIAGADLTRRARDQATRLGAEILSLRHATEIRAEDPYRIVKLSDGTELTANAVLIATGAAFGRLPAIGADRYHGTGVHYAVGTGEARLYEGKDVVLVGGGNSSLQAALLLARYVKMCHVLVRGDKPIAAQYLLDAIAGHPRITVSCNSAISEVRGGEVLDEALVKHPEGTRSIPCTAVFVFVGVKPSSAVVGDLVVRNDRGFILTGPQLHAGGVRHPRWPLARDPFLLETSVPGVFAVGDVRAGTIGRVAWAAAEGGAAVGQILEYLKGWDSTTRGAAEA